MAAFLPGAVRGFVWSVERVLGRSDLLWPLAVGFVLGVLVDERLIGRAPGAETFEHELTHALVALLFLRRVTRFVVTKRNGGWVQYSGGFGGVVADDLIGLAPYVLPTFTALSVAARPALDAGWFPWFDVWIGPTLGYHTWNTIRGTRRAWTSRPFVRAGTEEMVHLLAAPNPTPATPQPQRNRHPRLSSRSPRAPNRVQRNNLEERAG